MEEIFLLLSFQTTLHLDKFSMKVYAQPNRGFDTLEESMAHGVSFFFFFFFFLFLPFFS
jgi:hypothetical protein